MKVGMLTSVGDRCGIAEYSQDLADGLRKLVDLDVVAVWDRSSPWNAYLAQSTERLNTADVVHIQHEYSFWGSVLPRQNRFFEQVAGIGKPIVLTAHTLDPTTQVLGLHLPGPLPRKALKLMLAYYPPYRQTIERATFQIADRIIIHDSFAAGKLEGRGIPRSKMGIIPMGIPAANLEPGLGDAFRRKFGLEGRKLITVFGFVRPGRGYETALDALTKLGNDAVLIIAGGPQTESQKAYVDSLSADIEVRGLRDRVVITGYLPDEEVPGAMQAADIALIPQEHGTGSYSLMVALGYGKPILASDLRFLLEFEDVLWTFKRGDSEDLAGKLRILLEDEETRNRLSGKALAYAKDHSWDKIAEKTVEVYQELI
ncbi:MAG TPA: glycosyltransferase [Armatimonadota bacterium]|nr:glycosyltransferase [Armatimonadota bacterium]